MAWQLGFDLAQVAALLALTGADQSVRAAFAGAGDHRRDDIAGRQLIRAGGGDADHGDIVGIVRAAAGFGTDGVIRLNEPLLAGHWLAIVIGAMFFASFAAASPPN